jgi:hypothetical protein
LDQGDLFLRLRGHESGATVSPYAVFALVLGMDAEAMRSEPLVKEDYTLAGAESNPSVRAQPQQRETQESAVRSPQANEHPAPLRREAP